jgi:hypothetical protein
MRDFVGLQIVIVSYYWIPVSKEIGGGLFRSEDRRENIF